MLNWQKRSELSRFSKAIGGKCWRGGYFANSEQEQKEKKGGKKKQKKDLSRAKTILQPSVLWSQVFYE
jgi:hypothetical protein